MKYFQNLKNTIDFFLRNRFEFSRKNYSEKNEVKDEVFNTKELIMHEEFLLKKYDLSRLKNNSTKHS